MTKVELYKYYDVENIIGSDSIIFKITSKYDKSEYYFTFDASEVTDFTTNGIASKNILNMHNTLVSDMRDSKINKIYGRIN